MAGIIGWPVEHSLSPAMHNAAFARLGLNWVLRGLPGRPAPGGRGRARAGRGRLRGPERHDPPQAGRDRALLVGVRRGGGDRGGQHPRARRRRAASAATTPTPRASCGPSTSRRRSTCDGRDALVIGAGGAARAVAFALRGRGARVRVANRTPARAAELGDPVPFVREALDIDRRRSRPWSSTPPASACTATPCRPSCRWPGSAPARWWPTSSTGPGGTPWLAAAAARGARPVDGLGMLLHQGAAAFAQWTGREPPLEVMRSALSSRRPPS